MARKTKEADTIYNKRYYKKNRKRLNARRRERRREIKLKAAKK